MKALPPFPNYMQLRERATMPPAVWHGLRIGSVIAAFALVATLLVAPDTGLFILWKLLIPTLPIIFLIAPGLWRNICPLAAANQTPRLFNFTRALTLPTWLQEYAYVIGFTLFFILASTRKWLFNTNGTASALLVFGAMVAAFIGGVFFKGKSGWCSSMCPILPVQRIYNQTPIALIGNSHCNSCVGCAKNCYDFNPRAANLADLFDDDEYHRRYRKFFAGAFPGFILGYFLIPNPPATSIGMMYGGMLVAVLISLGVFSLLDNFIKVTPIKLTTIFGAFAINAFYWFTFPSFAEAVASLAGAAVPVAVIWATRAALLALSVYWIVRSYEKEPIFLGEVLQVNQPKIAVGAAAALKRAASDQLEVTLAPENKKMLVEEGQTLLQVAEANDLAIEPGCRMGVCGADPVVITEGMDNLSACRDDESATLERLGLGDNCRMACVARVNGPVTMSLDMNMAASAEADIDFAYDEAVKQVVVIGNGIAGVTAADHIRRRHPDCDVHLIGKESHHLYNRMAISRLIYGRSAMNGLYLQPDAWYDEKNITTWLNTKVSAINSAEQSVQLATGDSLSYDKLILATGSRSFVPPIPGVKKQGVFVLREADDAIRMRAWVQNEACHHATVIGGGLLGLEAAYALFKLGLQVTVLERSEWLLKRQLDERGGFYLKQYLERLGLTIRESADSDKILGDDRVTTLRLKDGHEVQTDLLLLAVGIRSNIDLARDIELDIGRAVKVNDTMQTSEPNIYAVGDVCEHDGIVYGLWPVAVEQAKVAAIHAVGGDANYTPLVPVTALKVLGVDLTSIGRFEANSADDIVIAEEDSATSKYRKLVINSGKIVGAILLGHPADAPAVTDAVKQARDVSHLLSALRDGDWDVLQID